MEPGSWKEEGSSSSPIALRAPQAGLGVGHTLSCPPPLRFSKTSCSIQNRGKLWGLGAPIPPRNLPWGPGSPPSTGGQNPGVSNIPALES